MDISTIGGLLASLLLPVGAISWFVSNYLDNLEAWKALSSSVKSALVLVASLIVGGIAYAILHTVPGTVLDQLQPVYALIYSIVVSWLAMQTQHNNELARQDRKAIRKDNKEIRKAQIKIASGPTGQG